VSAGKLDLSLEQGVTWRLPLLWRQPSPDGGVTPGEPYDLTNATAKMQIRTIVGGKLLTQISDTDGIELGTTDGTLTLTLTALKTSAVTEESAVYDLFVNFPSGDAVRLLEGAVSCGLAVTIS
jgi:hypothetical protein